MVHSKRQNLPAITGLRLFLAFLVVAFHAGGSDGTLRFASRPANLYFENLVASGYVSVGFFFVLSGFVLSYGYDLSERWTRNQWKRFLVARLARIYPVYVLALFVSFPLALLTMLKEPRHSALENIATLITTPLLIQSWFPRSSTMWNGPGWSLSAEIFFYLMFPFLGVFLWRLRRLWSATFMLGIVWVVAMGMASGLSLYFAHDLWIDRATVDPLRDTWNSVIKFDPAMHLPAFLAGILAARIFLQLSSGTGILRAGRGIWLYAPAIIVELLVLTHAPSIRYPLLHDGLLIPLHASIIIGLALGGLGLPRLLSNSFLVILGQASYALYLLHVPIARYWNLTAKHVLHRNMFGMYWFCGYSMLCIVISCVTYIWVEEPARRKVLQRFGRPQDDINALSRPHRSGLVSHPQTHGESKPK